MKSVTYTSCCGRRVHLGEYAPAGYSWRRCVWCALRRAFAAHGIHPEWLKEK